MRRLRNDLTVILRDHLEEESRNNGDRKKTVSGNSYPQEGLNKNVQPF